MAVSSDLNVEEAGPDQNQSVGIAWQLRPTAIRWGGTLKGKQALKLQRTGNDPSLCRAKQLGGRFACVVFNHKFSACTPFMHYGWGTRWTTSSAFVLPDAPVTSQEKPLVLWLHGGRETECALMWQCIDYMPIEHWIYHSNSHVIISEL